MAQFSLFLKLCAGRTAQILNVSALAAEAGISVNTAKAWLSVMEASYIIYRLQPHYRNYNKRLVKSPKLYFTDSGLACYLLGIRDADQLSTHYALGSLFENFIVIEFFKQRLNTGKTGGLYFWRDHKGMEIDLIIEEGNTIQAFEIKAGRTAGSDYFRNLNYWRKQAGQRIDDCTVIYGGEISQMTRDGRLTGWKELASGDTI